MVGNHISIEDDETDGEELEYMRCEVDLKGVPQMLVEELIPFRTSYIVGE